MEKEILQQILDAMALLEQKQENTDRIIKVIGDEISKIEERLDGHEECLQSSLEALKALISNARK